MKVLKSRFGLTDTVDYEVYLSTILVLRAYLLGSSSDLKLEIDLVVNGRAPRNLVPLTEGLLHRGRFRTTGLISE